MHIGVPLETHTGEKRVAATPETIKKLIGQGHRVTVQSGAGVSASVPDSAYEAAGAAIGTGTEAFAADLVLKVTAPDDSELAQIKSGTIVVGMLNPFNNDTIAKMAGQGITAFALEAAPRTSRAQSLDVLSSQANIAGYKAVLLGAHHYPRFMPMLMTAAGTVKAARVLVLGAGVAGLQAIATAKRLGAVVEASDVRPAVKEQIESLGAKFIDVPYETDEERECAVGVGGYARPMPASWMQRQAVAVHERAKQSDIVITTALIPGRKAPVLLSAETVAEMKPGSVVIDLAAEKGGNCDLTVPGEVIEHQGVTIVGYPDLANRMPNVASELYGTNLLHFLDEMGGATGHKVDHANDAVRQALVLEGGETRWPPPKVEKKAEPAPAKPVEAPVPIPQTKPLVPPPAKSHGYAPKPPSKSSAMVMSVLGILAAIAFVYLRYGKADTVASVETVELLQHVTVFVMAIFVGFQVVWNVAPALHTPLMSVTNAISGIIVVGGLLNARLIGSSAIQPSHIVAIVATLFATINIAGGFLVTRRMLAMFRK